VEKGIEPPASFLDLCESLPYHKSFPDENENKYSALPGEIYFPLPTNNEQLQIIHKLNSQRSVLVQGPPGTGKSHTIANLICHLLATGQSVLVTAKTSRALKVLHDKISDSIQPLCISILGNGIEERESLEKSVNCILTEFDRKDEIKTNLRIKEIEQKLRKNREYKAEFENKIISVREQEIREHIIAGGHYRGTAANIADRLSAERSRYDWFLDQIEENDEFPLTTEETKFLLLLLRKIDNNIESELSLYIPNPDKDIPTCDQLKELFNHESELIDFLKNSEKLISSPVGIALSNASYDQVVLVHDSIQKLFVEIENIRRRRMNWIENAIKDILSDSDLTWKELLHLSVKLINDIREIARIVQNYTVTIPHEMDRNNLLNDAKILKSHFESGGGIKKYGFITPKVIKKHGEFFHYVKIDGQDCTELAILEKLINFLNVDLTLRKVWLLWEGKASSFSEQFLLQIAEIDGLNEALERSIGLYTLKETAEKNINNVSGLIIPHFDDFDSLKDFYLTSKAILSKIKYKLLKKQIDSEDYKLSLHTLKEKAHPYCGSLLRAFRERNTEEYSSTLDGIKRLTKKKHLKNIKRNYIYKLAIKAPLLASELTNSTNVQLWIERLLSLENAWAFRRADAWLSQFLQSDSEILEDNVKKIEDDIRKDIAELASLKAWLFCFSRMKSDHQRHLMAWQQAMRRLGKGTGKHAHTHRLDAQRHLNECKAAIPAWVMPLHRVYETVEGAASIFNVIIVDEASQCGPESLPLLFLGEKIIVVGDEKQISPEPVGIDQLHVKNLMHNYLSDFSHSDSFGMENSLFAHGRIRFGNRVTLREHFRCMPEIIRFSNDLCYTSDPLIPLRQYPPDRLEPLKAIHLTNGFREGIGQKVINRPEAELLVTKLVECCKDKRYQGMSMGVIVLQGESQASIIEDLILKSIGAEEMKKRGIICGNPYSFQGDQRDVIFLSMVAAPNERIGSMTKEFDVRRFNVAASRAQEQMWLFHSVTSSDLNNDCCRRKLLNHFYGLQPQVISGVDIALLQEAALNTQRKYGSQPPPFDSWFEVDVALAIAKRGFRVIPQFHFAGKYIDLVVQGDKPQLAVECDGDSWHGLEEFEKDISRQRMLERCKWHFFRIRASRFYANPVEALKPLWSLLDKLGIFSENTQQFQSNEYEEETEVEEEEEDNELDEAADNVNQEEEALHDNKYVHFNRQLSFFETSPSNIQEALSLTPKILARMIIDILKKRPNHSCVRRNLSTYILKALNIRTRGIPRNAFSKKVDDNIAIMIRKGHIIAYRSKNERIKLSLNAFLEDI